MTVTASTSHEVTSSLPGTKINAGDGQLTFRATAAPTVPRGTAVVRHARTMIHDDAAASRATVRSHWTVEKPVE